MATITWEVTSADTGVTPNASGAFTPAQNDLLVVIVQAAASVSGSTEVPTASANGITFVKALQMTYASGANSLDIYVAEQFVGASPVSMTVSWAPADSATGTVIDVYAVSGMSRVGSAAVRQTASGFGGASSTPSVSFSAATLTGNPTILAMANGTNPNGVSVPTGWSNVNAVVAYSSPTTGYQGDRRNSGFVGTSISWGSASASIWGAVGIELDTSAASQDFTGTATLTGDGTLSTTQLPAIPGSAALSGSGSLGTTGIPAIPSVPIALSGSGSLSAVAAQDFTGTATLSGDGSLGTTGLPSATGTPALTGSGTLSATGQVGSGTPADVASSTVGAWDNGGGSVNVPAGTVNGDLLIAVAVKDGDTTVSNGTLPAAWTPKANYDGGAGSGNHIKVWYRYASNEPASYTYTGPSGSSSIVFFLRITNGPTSGDPFDATLAGTWVAAATINAPSVSPAGSDSLLICGASSYNGNGGAWTPPGTVTELQDTQPAAGYIDADICKQKLTSSGATGTRTFTPNPADSGIKTAWSFAIKSGTGTGSAFSGTATLSGSGSLGTGATPAIPGGASLSGSGSLGVVAAPAIPAVPVALSGSGSLSTVQKPIVAVPTAFSGDGTLSATGMKVVVGTADLSGSGTLAISTQVPAITGAIAALTGSGTLATGPHIPSLVQAVALSGSGALATTQIPGPKPAVALSGDGVLSTTQKPILAVAVALSGDGVLSAVAGGTVAGTAALTGSGTLAALQQAMTALGTAALTGSGTLTTTRIPAIPGIATLSGSGVLAITGKPILAVVSALSGDGTLAVTTFRPALVAVAGLSGVGILSTTAFVTFGVHTATLTGSGILSAAGTIPTSTFKVWNGSAWIAGILKRWDGSVWTTAVVKRWNGSSWVSI